MLEKSAGEECGREVFGEKRCREALEKSVVEKSWRQVLERSVVEKRSRRVLEKRVVETGVVEKSVGEKCL